MAIARSILFVLGCSFPYFSSLSEETVYRVLPEDFHDDKTAQMMRSYLRERVHEALDRRLGELEEALQTEAGIAAYQEERREFWRWTLGEMPERSSLNARITGVLEEDGFTIEKVIYESQPGFLVTANLYRPAGEGPFPAILHPCGHSKNGKAYESYQKVNRLLARNGFIVLCFDPIGQGERRQLAGRDRKVKIVGSGEHQLLGVAPILLGRSLATYMVWDGIRGIDYLCGRPDVDPNRIGCTGNSGGGNLTSFLMAYDDRIVAAAPGCFVTTHRRKNENPGPGDAEQNLFAQIRDGFDHPDFILSRAPKPTLILAATHDFVPIEGTWEAFRQAKRVYTRLGHPEKVELIEANEKHGYSRRLREGAVRFFARWLQGRKIEVFEEDEVLVLADEELQVSPDGQVLWMEGSRSLFELYAETESRFAAAHGELTKAKVREVTGIRPLDEIPRPKVEDHGGDSPKKLLFRPEPGIVLPGLYWSGGKGEPFLIAPSDGMNSALAEAVALQAKGHPVLVLEVRDTGETRTRNWRFFGADYYIAYMLGRCWLGMRAEDLLVGARWLMEENDATSVRIHSDGEVGPAAVHAWALESELVSGADARDGLDSWKSLMTDRNAYPHLPNAVQGALRVYDLPELEELE
jgi:dienelactone hydrolase